MRKHWATRVLMALALGAVLNVGVAWALAAFIGVPPPPAKGLGFGSVASPPWHRPVPADWPSQPRQSSRGSWWWCCTMIEQHASSPKLEVGPDGLLTPESMKVYREVGMEHSLCVIEWGWPMRSLDVAWPHAQRSVVSIRLLVSASHESSLRTGLALPARFAKPPWRTSLPLMPVWPGFAVNSLFYSLLAGAALFAPGAIRRTLRRRRGCCISCGYDLAGLLKCPECGSASPAFRRDFQSPEPAAATAAQSPS